MYLFYKIILFFPFLVFCYFGKKKASYNGYLICLQNIDKNTTKMCNKILPK